MTARLENCISLAFSPVTVVSATRLNVYVCGVASVYVPERLYPAPTSDQAISNPLETLRVIVNEKAQSPVVRLVLPVAVADETLVEPVTNE